MTNTLPIATIRMMLASSCSMHTVDEQEMQTICATLLVLTLISNNQVLASFVPTTPIEQVTKSLAQKKGVSEKLESGEGNCERRNRVSFELMHREMKPLAKENREVLVEEDEIRVEAAVVREDVGMEVEVKPSKLLKFTEQQSQVIKVHAKRFLTKRGRYKWTAFKTSLVKFFAMLKLSKLE
jgi:hypothetical protein